MYKFISDSSCDMVTDPALHFQSIPLTITTDHSEYVDDGTADVHAMLEDLASYRGRSYTACPNMEQWLAAYEGASEVYVVTMTSGLSGTYNSARSAAEQYKEEHPDARILVLDTLSTGAEQRLILEKIMDWKADGLCFDEIAGRAEEYAKSTRLFFIFRSLHNFAQNGRVNKMVASAIGRFNIRVLGTASSVGTVEAIGNCRGDKKALAALMNEMLKAGYAGGRVNIAHTENPEYAGAIADMIRETFPHARIRIYENKALTAYYSERGGIILGCECV